MSVEKRWRLVAYDVRDPKRYRRVFRILRGAGRTLQYSLFRCHLDAHEVERLAEVMAPEDRLLVVDLCPTCATNVVSRNHVEGWAEESPAFVVVAGPTPADQAPPGVSAPGLRTSTSPAETRRRGSD